MRGPKRTERSVEGRHSGPDKWHEEDHPRTGIINVIGSWVGHESGEDARDAMRGREERKDGERGPIHPMLPQGQRECYGRSIRLVRLEPSSESGYYQHEDLVPRS